MSYSTNLKNQYVDNTFISWAPWEADHLCLTSNYLFEYRKGGFLVSGKWIWNLETSSVLKNRDARQTALELVSYHPIRAFHLGLYRLMRMWHKIMFDPFMNGAFPHETTNRERHLLGQCPQGLKGDYCLCRCHGHAPCELVPSWGGHRWVHLSN